MIALPPQVQILSSMSDIYYGRVASPWALDVDDWNVDPHQVSGPIREHGLILEIRDTDTKNLT